MPVDNLLLETGDFILQEDGTSKRLNESSGSAGSFAILPNAGHTPGAITINVTYAAGASAPASGAVPLSVQSGGGSVTAGSWVQDSSTTGHFTFVEGAASGTPTVFADSVTSTTKNFSNAAVAPGAPTIGTLTDLGGGVLEITFSAPADNGGASITNYVATSSSGGITGSGASSPITISGVNTGVSQTVTVTATNSAGTGSDSSASNSITPAYAAPAGYATFDGSGSTYLTRAALDACKTYPFWVSALVQSVRDRAYETAYCVWCCAKPTMADGSAGEIYKSTPKGYSIVGSASSFADSLEASLTAPYWDNIVWEFRSATDRRVWINGVQEGISTTSRALDISTGSPTFRIGIESSGSNPFSGGISNLIVGTGTLTAADRTLLATIGENYANVAPTAGAVTSWYPLAANGTDIIGGFNMTDVGTVVYSSARVAHPKQPTRSAAIYEVHKSTALATNLPTVTPGSTSPISTSGWSNLADVAFLDISYSGNVAGTWTTRVYHYSPTVPVIPGGHVVFVDGGHEVISEWSAHGLNRLIQTLVEAGYGVAVTQVPLHGPTDPGYDGSAHLHDGFWSLYDSTHNPIERWLGPTSIALNYLVNLYVKRSCVVFPAAVGAHRTRSRSTHGSITRWSACAAR